MNKEPQINRVPVITQADAMIMVALHSEDTKFVNGEVRRIQEDGGQVVLATIDKARVESAFDLFDPDYRYFGVLINGEPAVVLGEEYIALDEFSIPKELVTANELIDAMTNLRANENPGALIEIVEIG